MKVPVGNMAVGSITAGSTKELLFCRPRNMHKIQDPGSDPGFCAEFYSAAFVSFSSLWIVKHISILPYPYSKLAAPIMPASFPSAAIPISGSSPLSPPKQPSLIILRRGSISVLP